jgi:hypothetical protein
VRQELNRKVKAGELRGGWYVVAINISGATKLFRIYAR